MQSSKQQLIEINDMDKNEGAHSTSVPKDEEALAGESSLSEHQDLHRGLKSRHLTMIALGGAIGTGLIIGSGKGLAAVGPASLLIGYAITGVLCFIVMSALGEMATWLPLGTSFPGYASRFVDPALGFALGWIYLFKYLLSTANQLTALALVLQYWVPRDRVNPGVFIAVFWVLIVTVNYFGVRIFGEVEFWLCALKLTVLIGIILLSIILASGGGPNHDATGFRYWSDPGAVKPYIASGSLGKFLSVYYALNSGVFAYLGTELVGITVGEAQNPRKAIPRAIRMTFWRITFFYVVTIFLLGLLVPYNSEELVFANKAGKTAAASPFVVAIKLAGIPTLPGIMNGCIMIFNLSASTSDLYIATRTLYSMAVQGHAPRVLSHTNNRKLPIWSFVVCSSLSLLAFMNVSTSSTIVFGYFVSLSVACGLLTWISILLSHIHFVKARRAHDVKDSSLYYRAPFGLLGSWIALVFCVTILVFSNFAVFTRGSYGNFDYKNFITSYLAIPVFLILLASWKLIHKTKHVTASEADLFTGKDKIDREEAQFLELQKEKPELSRKLHRFYKNTIGLAF